MFYKFNIYELCLKLLPPILRNKVIKAILFALLCPLDLIYTSFLEIKASFERKITHNAFTIYLEKYLNDQFDLNNKIYIRDEYTDRSTVLTKRQEGYPEVFMTRKSEDTDTICMSSDHVLDVEKVFVVMIPSIIDTEANRSLIIQIVNYYKFSGVTFKVEVYE